MALFEVKYHRLVFDPTRGSEPQTPDQACMAIGDAVVAGFTVHRYQVTDRQDRPVTVVAVISPHEILFGAYEFTRLA